MIKIGCKYKDRLSGLEGIAVGSVTYITGCNQALIQPHCTEPSKLPESQWIDEQRLECIVAKPVELPEVESDVEALHVRAARLAIGPDREPPKR